MITRLKAKELKIFPIISQEKKKKIKPLKSLSKKLPREIQSKKMDVMKMPHNPKNELLSMLYIQSLLVNEFYDFKSEMISSSPHVLVFKTYAKELHDEIYHTLQEKIKSVTSKDEKELKKEIKNFQEIMMIGIRKKLSDHIKDLQFAERAEICCPISLDFMERPIVVFCKDTETGSTSPIPHLFDYKYFLNLQRIPLPGSKKEYVKCPLDRRTLSLHECFVEIPIVTDLIKDYKRKYDFLLEKANKLDAVKEASMLCKQVGYQEKTIESFKESIAFAIQDYQEKRKMSELVNRLKIDPLNSEHKNFWIKTNGVIPPMVSEMMKLNYSRFATEAGFITKIDMIRAQAKKQFYQSWLNYYSLFSPNKNIKSFFDAKDVRRIELKL